MRRVCAAVSALRSRSPRLVRTFQPRKFGAAMLCFSSGRGSFYQREPQKRSAAAEADFLDPPRSFCAAGDMLPGGRSHFLLYGKICFFREINLTLTNLTLPRKFQKRIIVPIKVLNDNDNEYIHKSLVVLTKVNILLIYFELFLEKTSKTIKFEYKIKDF